MKSFPLLQWLIPFVLFAALFGLLTVTGSYKIQAAEPSYQHLSYIESVFIEEAGFSLDAKLDSGARVSSIRAYVLNGEELNLGDITSGEYDTSKKPKIGEMLRFEVADDDDEVHFMELPLKSVTKIKSKQGGYIYRPVVEMTFCINGSPIRGEVNLAPRPGFNYAVLVGRNMLKKGDILIDSSTKYLGDTLHKNCKH